MSHAYSRQDFNDGLVFVALLMVQFLLVYPARLVPLGGERSVKVKPNTLRGKTEA